MRPLWLRRRGAVLRGDRHGLVDNWLRHVPDVPEKHEPRSSPSHEEQRLDRLCELNVVEQVVNVVRSSSSRMPGSGPGAYRAELVYGLRTALRDLDVRSASSGAAT